jgi:hypothetical protein
MTRPSPTRPAHDAPLTRREALRAAALAPVALDAAASASLSAQPAPRRRAKACIVLWMSGGPPQHETWDPKPDATAEVRGPFRPIRTSVPGVHVCELMPKTARLAGKLCVLRGVHTDNASHPGSSYEMLTGNEHPLGKGRDDVIASRNDWPSLAAVVKRFVTPPPGVPAAVVLPEPFFNVPIYPGQDAGFLGSEWDPWRLTCDPTAKDFHLPELALPAEVPQTRLRGRQTLLGKLERQRDPASRGPAPARFHSQASEAHKLLSGERLRRVFDLGQEPAALRERYGRHKFGQCCLLARRLVEAGTTLVQVNWHREPNDDTPMWDAHWRLEENLKSKMPPMDAGYVALLEDLDARGLLSETLVVWMGEFGRTPKLEYVKPHPAPGRNHWGGCFSVVLAGAGVRGGQVWGASDKEGAFPKEGAVRPADLTATLFSSLGIDPGGEIRDRLGRPHPISRGRALTQLY